MDSVNVIFSDNLLADAGYDITCLRLFGIQEAIFSYSPDEFGILVAHVPATGSVPFSQGERHHPCVELHTALVAFVDGEAKRIVAGLRPGCPLMHPSHGSRLEG